MIAMHSARQTRMMAVSDVRKLSQPCAAVSDGTLKIGAFVWVRMDREQHACPASIFEAAAEKYVVPKAGAKVAYEEFMRMWDRPQERLRVARIWFVAVAEMCSELELDLDAELERVATAA